MTASTARTVVIGVDGSAGSESALRAEGVLGHWTMNDCSSGTSTLTDSSEARASPSSSRPRLAVAPEGRSRRRLARS